VSLFDIHNYSHQILCLSAMYLHNLTTILSDDNIAAPGRLSYAIQNPTDVDFIPLTLSDHPVIIEI
jgi:hypothetical protein